MRKRPQLQVAHLHVALTLIGAAGVVAACSADDRAVGPGAAATARFTREGVATGPFQFTPLASSAVCTSGGDPVQPLVLPPGYEQRTIASEPQFRDAIDMNTQNETGPQAGRYLYRAHEVGSNGSV